VIAVERYTYDDAIALLTLARDTLLQGRNFDQALACTVEIALARALRNAGIYEDRDAVLERAWNHAYDIRDYELLADVAVEARSGTTLPSDRWTPRIEEVVVALDETSRGRLLASCLMAHSMSLQPGDRARELAEWALARSDAFGPLERCVAYMHAMYALNATS